MYYATFSGGLLQVRKWVEGVIILPVLLCRCDWARVNGRSGVLDCFVGGFLPRFLSTLSTTTTPMAARKFKSSRCNKQNTVESLLTATSLQRPVFLFRRAVHTVTRVLINLFSTATATKACPQLPKISSQQRPVFSATDEKVNSGHDI